MFIIISVHHKNTDVYKIKDGNNLVLVSLKKINDSCYFLIAESYLNNNKILTSTFRLDYPIYNFQIGDIDNNGLTDIGVGVIKSCIFDKIVRKRPFFFKLENGYITKLWMGTNLSHPLDNFKIIKEKNISYLRSIEFEKDNKYLVAQYIWNGFGFRFCNYLSREISLNKANKLLNYE
jgi:hypothetical protein